MVNSLESLRMTFPFMEFQWLEHKNIQRIKSALGSIKWRFVGGIVRDSLLGKFSYDIDICVQATPEDTMRILEKNHIAFVKTGIEHGTLSVFLPGEHGKIWCFEITSLRKDIITHGRKATVIFGGSWEEDSYRRDFTINGLMLDAEEGAIYDYVGGLRDLKNNAINFIGDAQKRIQEDYLRIMRFIRFFSRFSLGFPDEETISVLKRNVDKMEILSKERILSEFLKILMNDQWQIGIKIINELDIDKKIFGFEILIPSYINQYSCIFYSPCILEDVINFRLLQCFLSNKDKTLIKNWPFTRMQKMILQSIIYDTTDIYLAMAKIWEKCRNCHYLEAILYAYQVRNPLPVNIPKNFIEKFHQERQKIDILSVPPKKRGNIILDLRYKALKGLL